MCAKKKFAMSLFPAIKQVANLEKESLEDVEWNKSFSLDRDEQQTRSVDMLMVEKIDSK